MNQFINYRINRMIKWIVLDIYGNLSYTTMHHLSQSWKTKDHSQILSFIITNFNYYSKIHELIHSKVNHLNFLVSLSPVLIWNALKLVPGRKGGRNTKSGSDEAKWAVDLVLSPSCCDSSNIVSLRLCTEPLSELSL